MTVGFANISGKQGKREKSCLLVVLLLLLNGSNSLISANVVTTKLSVIINTVVLLILVFSKRPSVIIEKRDAHGFIGIVILMLLSLLVNLDFSNSGGYVVILLELCQALLLFQLYTVSEVKDAFIKAMLIVSVASIVIMYVLPNTPIYNFLPTITNKTGLSFSTIGFAGRLNLSSNYSNRNYGAFSEPAVFVFFILLGVVFEITSNSSYKRKIVSLLIFSFVAFTTISPIGLGLTVVSLALLCFYLMSEKQYKECCFFVILSVVAITIILSKSDFIDILNAVIEKSSLEEGSGAGRIDVFVKNITSWLSHPAFGGGLKEVVGISGEFGFNTSTSGVLLAGFGTFLFVLVTILQYQTFISIAKNRIIAVCLFLAFIVVINDFSYIQNNWFWIVTLLPKRQSDMDYLRDQEIE